MSHETRSYRPSKRSYINNLVRDGEGGSQKSRKSASFRGNSGFWCRLWCKLGALGIVRVRVAAEHELPGLGPFRAVERGVSVGARLLLAGRLGLEFILSCRLVYRANPLYFD